MDASLEAMFAKLRTLPPPMEVPLRYRTDKNVQQKKTNGQKTPGGGFFWVKRKKTPQLSWMEVVVLFVFVFQKWEKLGVFFKFWGRLF